MDGFLVVFAFLGLFLLGFPVVLAIAIPCLTYIFIKDLPIDLVAQRTLYALDSFPLVAVPVFLFVGSLMTSAGISAHIYRFADTAVGRLPGGLAQVNIFGSLIFSGMSGSALADIGGLGRIEIDAMRKKGFSPAFAAAVTSSSAIIGPIFPPSIPLIIYGTVTGAAIAGTAGTKSRHSWRRVGQRSARGKLRRRASQAAISISMPVHSSPGRMPPSSSWITEAPVTVP